MASVPLSSQLEKNITEKRTFIHVLLYSQTIVVKQLKRHTVPNYIMETGKELGHSFPASSIDKITKLSLTSSFSSKTQVFCYKFLSRWYRFRTNCPVYTNGHQYSVGEGVGRKACSGIIGGNFPLLNCFGQKYGT